MHDSVPDYAHCPSDPVSSKSLLQHELNACTTVDCRANLRIDQNIIAPPTRAQVPIPNLAGSPEDITPEWPQFHGVNTKPGLPAHSMRDKARGIVTVVIQQSLCYLTSQLQEFEADLNALFNQAIADISSERDSELFEVRERYEAMKAAIKFKSSPELDQVYRSIAGYSRIGDVDSVASVKARYSKLRNEFETFEQARLVRQEGLEVKRVNEVFKRNCDHVGVTRDIRFRKYLLGYQRQVRVLEKRKVREKISCG